MPVSAPGPSPASHLFLAAQGGRAGLVSTDLTCALAWQGVERGTCWTLKGHSRPRGFIPHGDSREAGKGFFPFLWLCLAGELPSCLLPTAQSPAQTRGLGNPRFLSLPLLTVSEEDSPELQLHPTATQGGPRKHQTAHSQQPGSGLPPRNLSRPSPLITPVSI